LEPLPFEVDGFWPFWGEVGFPLLLLEPLPFEVDGFWPFWGEVGFPFVISLQICLI
jgi:hypothetical protein